MATELNNIDIKGRTAEAFLRYKFMASRYRSAVGRFRDVSSPYFDQLIDYDNAHDESEQVLEIGQPVGNINHLRVNLQTKVDTIAIGDPDWHIQMLPGAEDATEIAREAVSKVWDHCDLTWVCKRVITNRFLGPLGILTYLYDADDGPIFQEVKPNDFAPDPHVSDWTKIRFACRKVYMPPDVAREKYPNYANYFGKQSQSSAESDAKRSNAIELHVYWDANTEAIIYKDAIIKRSKNRYGQPPFLFLHGDLDPASPHDTGDMENAAGLQAGEWVLQNALFNSARHGQPHNLFDPEAFVNRKSIESLEKGREQGYTAVNTGFLEKAVKRIEGEQIHPALMESLQMLQQATDEAMFVTPSQRGSAPTGAKFATEVMASNNLAGARGNQARIAFEKFATQIAEKIIWLLITFESNKDVRAYYVLEALKGIAKIKVVETSTAYKDPVAMQQQAIMVFNVALQAMQAGVPVNLSLLFLDVLREFGKRDPQKYLVPQATPAASPGQQALSPGGAPVATGTPPTPNPGMTPQANPQAMAPAPLPSGG